jgi:hypothetical protein
LSLAVEVFLAGLSDAPMSFARRIYLIPCG